jgi:DNA-binding NarL/FixJ family response regulator
MDSKLSEREMQIAIECCKGKTARVIAEEFGISKRTVDSHKNNIYRKYGISNNIELIHKLYNLK